jgi:hypothetical protein
MEMCCPWEEKLDHRLEGMMSLAMLSSSRHVHFCFEGLQMKRNFLVKQKGNGKEYLHIQRNYMQGTEVSAIMMVRS